MTLEMHGILTVQFRDEQDGGITISTWAGTFLSTPEESEASRLDTVADQAREEKSDWPEEVAILFYRIIPNTLLDWSLFQSATTAGEMP